MCGVMLRPSVCLCVCVCLTVHVRKWVHAGVVQCVCVVCGVCVVLSPSAVHGRVQVPVGMSVVPGLGVSYACSSAPPPAAPAAPPPKPFLCPAGSSSWSCSCALATARGSAHSWLHAGLPAAQVCACVRACVHVWRSWAGGAGWLYVCVGGGGAEELGRGGWVGG